jgi:hypothetical protein
MRSDGRMGQAELISRQALHDHHRRLRARRDRARQVRLLGTDVTRRERPARVRSVNLVDGHGVRRYRPRAARRAQLLGDASAERCRHCTRGRWRHIAQICCLPMPAHCPVVHLGWALADVDHVGDASMALARATLRLAQCASAAWALVEISPQLTASLHVYRLINGFV